MKRCVAFIVLLIATTSAHGEDPATRKRELINELLNVIDAKALTQATLNIAYDRLERSTAAAQMPKGLGEENREGWQAMMKEQADEVHALRERLYARLDYAGQPRRRHHLSGRTIRSVSSGVAEAARPASSSRPKTSL